MDRLSVGVGTTVLCRGMATTGIDGIGHYTSELLNRLSADPSLEVHPFTFGANGVLADGSTPYRLPRFSVASLPSLLLNQSCLASQKLRRRVDLIHATDHLIPRAKGIPVIATVMDAIPLAHPEWVNYRLRNLKNAIWQKSVGFADHVITISDYSKADLVTYFGLPEQKISVTPLGVDERWFARPTPEQLCVIRARYGLPDNFLVFVGTLQPRKNLIRIIDAHRTLPDAIRHSHPLLIIGREGRHCTEALDRLKAEDLLVRWLKYVPGEDLPGILRCASALVFPSLYEGFGLPVLEAFAAELPVITSNTTSLPEVAGNAALLVDPCDTENIAWAMQQLIEDNDLAARLRQEGRCRASEFTWARTVRATVDIYRRLDFRY